MSSFFCTSSCVFSSAEVKKKNSSFLFLSGLRIWLLFLFFVVVVLVFSPSLFRLHISPLKLIEVSFFFLLLLLHLHLLIHYSRAISFVFDWNHPDASWTNMQFVNFWRAYNSFSSLLLFILDMFDSTVCFFSKCYRSYLFFFLFYYIFWFFAVCERAVLKEYTYIIYCIQMNVFK